MNIHRPKLNMNDYERVTCDSYFVDSLRSFVDGVEGSDVLATVKFYGLGVDGDVVQTKHMSISLYDIKRLVEYVDAQRKGR